MKAPLAYYRQKAEQCRRLADSLNDRDDPAVTLLLGIADEFDADADALEARIAREAPDLARADQALEIV